MAQGAYMDVDEQFLDDLWSLYFHDPCNSDWTLPSYVRICDVTSVEMFDALTKHISTNLHLGMFFLFRESVFPCWDDPGNINGGSLSFKVMKNDVNRFWSDLCKKMLREDIIAPSDREKLSSDLVTGMSISPKKNFCIIKVWLGDTQITERRQLHVDPRYNGEVLYKAHRDNIAGNAAVAAART